MARQLEIFKPSEHHHSITKLAKWYPEIYLDKSFQRLGGFERGSGWSQKQCESYMGHLFMKAVCNIVIIAHVDSCLDVAIKLCTNPATNNKDSQENLKYWQNLSDKGYKWVSIDGNNTSSTIYHFVEGEIPARNPDGSTFTAEDVDNDTIYEERIRILELTSITYTQMTELFRALNMSQKLNPQEFRQAKPSQISQFVRASGDLSRGLYSKYVFTKEKDLDKRGHEEELAKFVLRVKSGYTKHTTCKNLDKMYDCDNSISDDVKSKIEKVIDVVTKLYESKKSVMLGKARLAAFLDLVYHINLAGYEVRNAESLLWDFFLELDSEFSAESGSVLEKNQEEMSYSYWMRTHNKNYKKMVKKYMEELNEEKCSELVESGTISLSKIPRSSKDRFTLPQKLQLWGLQEKKDREGNDINLIDIYNGEVEADHVVSVKNGGETTISNGELMRKAENRSKGSRNNVPHFPHQKEQR